MGPRQATIAKEKKPATKEKDPKAKAKGTDDSARLWPATKTEWPIL